MTKPEPNTDVCARAAPHVQQPTARPAAKPASRPTKLHADTVQRCTICGLLKPCDQHPNSTGVRWTRARQTAWNYIDRAGDQPVRHFETNAEEAERYWPGVDAGDCVYVLQLYRQWVGEPKPI